MASTRKYDIDHINSSAFVKTFRKEKPKLIATKPEDCERLATDLIKSIQISLNSSCPKFDDNNKPKTKSIAYRLPRNISDLFLISRALLNENRRQNYRTANYQSTLRPNHSKIDFFEKQLAYYIGDQCSNKLAFKKNSKLPSVFPIDENRIDDLITRLPSDKLPGLDFIPNEIWQCILKCDRDYLMEFIRILVQNLYFPHIFKQGKLIVFRKPFRRGYEPENFRFITVQSAICMFFFLNFNNRLELNS